METSSFSYDAKSQVVKLSFPEQLPLGPEKAVLDITFSGIMNNEVSQLQLQHRVSLLTKRMYTQMAGFYRSAYKNQEGKDDFMYSTQCESCDARRAFPWLVTPVFPGEINS